MTRSQFLGVGMARASLLLIMGSTLLALSREPGMAGAEILPASSSNGDFADFLVTRDFVAEGTLTAIDTVSRARLGGCGTPDLGAIRAFDVQFHLTRPIFGVAEDSTVVVTVAGAPQYPAGMFVPGAHVLLWGFYNCTDGWRLWGNFAVITANNQVVPSLHRPPLRLTGQTTKTLLRFAALDSAVAAKEDHNGARFFTGKDAVALVRVTAITDGPGHQYTCEIDSLGWAFGEGAAAPRFLDINAPSECSALIEVGDSLLVPLSAEASERVLMESCPSALLVKSRFAPAFGVPLEFLGYALKSTEAGLEVRAFVSNE